MFSVRAVLVHRRRHSIPLGVPVRESQGEGSIVVALPQSAVPWADRIADIVCWGGLETQGIGQVTQ